jgi:uncharacterized protein YciI
MSEKRHFIAMLHPGRPDLPATMTEAEAEAIGEHSAHLERHFGEGSILFAGFSPEVHVGIVVLECPTKDEASRIMAADPAVERGVLTCEVSDFEVFLAHGAAAGA